MQPDGTTDLGKTITMVHMRFTDTGVAELSIAYHARSEHLRQRRASRMSLASRDFFGRLLTAQRGADAFFLAILLCIERVVIEVASSRLWPALQRRYSPGV